MLNSMQHELTSHPLRLGQNPQADAPYSSVYRPAQPLSSLVAGGSTAAGAGGSQGVWTLTVTDTDTTSRCDAGASVPPAPGYSC